MKQLAAVLVLCGAVLSGSCAVGLSPVLLPSYVRQRNPVDCMVASLATMLGVTYEVADGARVAAGIPLGDGLTAAQLQVVAKQLHVELVYDSTPNPVQEDGVFAVRWDTGDVTEPTLHAVYLQDGWVYDPALERAQPWVLWLKDVGPAQFLYVLRRK